MKRLAFLVLAVLSLPLCAADIASCSNPTGKSYYPQTGIVSAKDSGWHEDKITGGITKLYKQGDNEYDILFVDAWKKIISVRQDGGHVMLLSRGENVVSVLVVYPGKTVEVYTFLKTSTGKLEYIQTLSRVNDGVNRLITKASIMRGDCDYIDFGAL